MIHISSDIKHYLIYARRYGDKEIQKRKDGTISDVIQKNVTSLGSVELDEIIKRFQEEEREFVNFYAKEDLEEKLEATNTIKKLKEYNKLQERNLKNYCDKTFEFNIY